MFRNGHPNFQHKSKRVLVDRNDWIRPIWHSNDNYKAFDLILSGNLFKNVKYPANVRPWAIGLTERQIKYIDTFANVKPTKTEIGYNFRVPHNLRKVVVEGLSSNNLLYPLKQHLTVNKQHDSNTGVFDINQFYWEQTTRRHSLEYFRIINNYLFFLAVGGYYEFRPFLYQPYSIIDRIKRKPFHLYYEYLRRKHLDFSDAIFVFQYDSFRLWETMYAKTCPIYLDVDKWNFLFPCQPTEGVHYIGIRDFNFDAIIAKINQMGSQEIEYISQEGRKWVYQNYEPRAVSRRLLDWLSENDGK